MKKRTIETVFAFVADEPDGSAEMVAGFCRSGSPWLLPLISESPASVEHLRPIAKEIARRSRAPVRLVRFSVREDLEVIEPEPEQQPWK